MKKLNRNIAFTLIELLVVITIIGILATGAVTVYTTQIQKARDTTRLNDIQALQGAVEQIYQDTSNYPQSDEFATGGLVNVSDFMQRIPGDPKTTQGCASTTACDYIYIVGDDVNDLTLGAYELSTGFENSSNVTNKATVDTDGGDDNSRYEVGLNVDSADTNGLDTTRATKIETSGCLDLLGAAPASTVAIKVNKECN